MPEDISCAQDYLYLNENPNDTNCISEGTENYLYSNDIPKTLLRGRGNHSSMASLPGWHVGQHSSPDFV